MPQPSLYNFIVKRPGLLKLLKPIARWQANAAGYRQIGLRYDDLLPEENDVMQLALKRLSPREAYDRIFRIRRAFQCSLSHTILPKEEWTKDEDDREYLQPIVREIEAELQERDDLNSMVIRKRSQK